MANGIVDTLETSADVAIASSKGVLKAVSIGAVPIILFGAVIAMSILVVRLPLMFFEREA